MDDEELVPLIREDRLPDNPPDPQELLLETSQLTVPLRQVTQLQELIHREVDELMVVARELALLKARLATPGEPLIQSIAETIRIPFTPDELITSKIREMDGSMLKVNTLRDILSQNVSQLVEDCRPKVTSHTTPVGVPQPTSHVVEVGSIKGDHTITSDPNFDPESLIREMERDMDPKQKVMAPRPAAPKRSFLGPAWGGAKG
jgi:hypothetical protein